MKGDRKVQYSTNQKKAGISIKFTSLKVDCMAKSIVKDRRSLYDRIKNSQICYNNPESECNW